MAFPLMFMPLLYLIGGGGRMGIAEKPIGECRQSN